MKTELESKQMRDLLTVIKSMEADLYAYREFYQYVLDSRRFDGSELVREFLRLKKIGDDEMSAKYGDALEALADESDPQSSDQALKLLAQWKPIGRPN